MLLIYSLLGFLNICNGLFHKVGGNMIRIENDCVGCERCIGCGRNRTKHYYCDKCKNEEDLYYFEGEELCIDCIIKDKLQKVND